MLEMRASPGCFVGIVGGCWGNNKNNNNHHPHHHPHNTHVHIHNHHNHKNDKNRTTTTSSTTTTTRTTTTSRTSPPPTTTATTTTTTPPCPFSLPPPLCLGPWPAVGRKPLNNHEHPFIHLTCGAGHVHGPAVCLRIIRKEPSAVAFICLIAFGIPLAASMLTCLWT